MCSKELSRTDHSMKDLCRILLPGGKLDWGRQGDKSEGEIHVFQGPPLYRGLKLPVFFYILMFSIALFDHFRDCNVIFCIM